VLGEKKQKRAGQTPSAIYRRRDNSVRSPEL
jgi:hypothetical protein